MAALDAAGPLPWPGPGNVALVALVRSSDWRERDGAGRTLVVEHGRLAGVGLQGRLRLGAVADLEAGLSRAGGERAYDGSTSTGVAATSSAGLSETQAEAGLATLSASQGWAAGWSLGLQGRLNKVDRRLRDTPQASGYAERWRWASLAPQLRWQGGWQQVELNARLAIGRVWWTDLRLALPGRDEAHLVPSGQRTRELALSARLPLGSAGAAAAGSRWALQAGWHWADTRFGASPAVAVLRNGQLSGGALQPATGTSQRELSLGLTLDW